MKGSRSLPKRTSNPGFLRSDAGVSLFVPAVLHKAVQLLRAAELSEAYEDAWAEWAAAGEAGLWEVAAGEGVNA